MKKRKLGKSGLEVSAIVRATLFLRLLKLCARPVFLKRAYNSPGSRRNTDPLDESRETRIRSQAVHSWIGSEPDQAAVAFGKSFLQGNQCQILFPKGGLQSCHPVRRNIGRFLFQLAA